MPGPCRGHTPPAIEDGSGDRPRRARAARHRHTRAGCGDSCDRPIAYTEVRNPMWRQKDTTGLARTQRVTHRAFGPAHGRRPHRLQPRSHRAYPAATPRTRRARDLNTHNAACMIIPVADHDIREIVGSIVARHDGRTGRVVDPGLVDSHTLYDVHLGSPRAILPAGGAPSHLEAALAAPCARTLLPAVYPRGDRPL